VAVGVVLGYLFAIPAPAWFGLPAAWGAAGLALAAGAAGWTELLLLRRTLNSRIGSTSLPTVFVLKLWGAACVAAALAWAVKRALPAPVHPVLAGAAVLGAYGIMFILTTVAVRVSEATAVLERIRR
jgi:putative peptidoglycan lipid II flippase